MQKQIILDSQILNNIQLCERKVQYAFIDSIQPREKGEALERGDLMHKLLEVYESLRCNLLDPKKLDELIKLGVDVNSSEPKDAAIKYGRIYAANLDLPREEIEEVIFQYEEFVEYYKEDPWETLAVEEVGTDLLYEDENYKILYAYKIDRLAKKDNIIVPWDYKTSKQRKIVSSLSNQFIGYAWATKSNYVIVDKIGFQKTLKPAERFQRIFLSYDNERIEEWQKNAIYWSLAYADLLETHESSMNLTSCDKYSGCIYRPICEKAPSAREWIINRDYQIEKKWDPSEALEKENV